MHVTGKSKVLQFKKIISSIDNFTQINHQNTQKVLITKSSDFVIISLSNSCNIMGGCRSIFFHEHTDKSP